MSGTDRKKPEISGRQAVILLAAGAALMLAMQWLIGPGDDDALDPVMPQPPALDLSENMPPPEAAEIRKAYAALVATCPGILRNTDLVTRVDAMRMTGGPFDIRYDEYGWTRYVTFSIEGDWPDSGPETGSPGPRPHGAMSGHRLRFSVGFEGRPGVFAMKPWSQWFCGLPVAETSDAFAPLPEAEPSGG